MDIVLQKDIELDSQQYYPQIYQNLKSILAFDTKVFERLTEETDTDVALKILARFSITLRECLQQAQVGLDKDSSELIWKACHKVTGSAELVGFKQYGTQSRALTQTLKTTMSPQLHVNEVQHYLVDGYKLMHELETAFPRLNEFF